MDSNSKKNSIYCVNCEGKPEYQSPDPSMDILPLRCRDYEPIYSEDPRRWSCEEKNNAVSYFPIFE
jgi:hypothetical protein